MTSRFCTACGATLRPEERFCTACGAAAIPAAATGPAPPDGDRSWRVFGIIVLVLVLVIGVVALAQRSSDSTSTADSKVRDRSTSSTMRRGSSTTSTTVRSTTSTTARRRSTTSTTTSSQSIAGLDRWIAVLASIPTTLSWTAINEEINRTEMGIDRETFMVRSDDFGSMRPGYWVVYVASWDSADGATAYCRSVGRAVPDRCYAKLLSR